MNQVKSGDTVKVHYTGKLEDGTVFDSSKKRGPFRFTVGQDQVISGFEKALIGMRPGESKTAQVAADKAYGPHRTEMVLKVDRSRFPEDVEPKLGQHYEISNKDGQKSIFTITDIAPTTVTLDGNHPLAGKNLVFDIELVDITE